MLCFLRRDATVSPGCGGLGLGAPNDHARCGQVNSVQHGGRWSRTLRQVQGGWAWRETGPTWIRCLWSAPRPCVNHLWCVCRASSRAFTRLCERRGRRMTPYTRSIRTRRTWRRSEDTPTHAAPPRHSPTAACSSGLITFCASRDTCNESVNADCVGPRVASHQQVQLRALALCLGGLWVSNHSS